MSLALERLKLVFRGLSDEEDDDGDFELAEDEGMDDTGDGEDEEL